MTDTFARMRQLNGTTAEWAANDIVIGLGEFAIEKIAGGAMRLKLGDGIAKFSQLPYFDPGVFSYVLKGGDTMSGPLVAPGVTINAGGLTVSGGNSNISAPINLGPSATTGEPTAAHKNDATVPTTHWVQTQVAGIITGLNYLGTWNAATNTPPLASGGLGVPTPARGDFYMVSVAGSTDLDGNTTWLAGDFVAFNGNAWQRIPQPLTFDQIVAGLGYTPANKAGDTFTGPVVVNSTLALSAPANGADLKTFRESITPAGALRFTGRTDAGADQGWVEIGRDGSISGSAVNPSQRLFNETVLAAPAAEMRVNVPAGAKAIELWFAAFNVGNANDTVGLVLNELQGSTVIVTPSHAVQTLYGSGNSAGASTAAPGNGWQLGGAQAAYVGVLRPQLFAAATHINADYICFNAAGAAIKLNCAYWSANSSTGFRLANGSGTQFAATSYFRCLAIY
jgi:hypothetical protein